VVLDVFGRRYNLQGYNFPQKKDLGWLDLKIDNRKRV